MSEKSPVKGSHRIDFIAGDNLPLTSVEVYFRDGSSRGSISVPPEGAPIYEELNERRIRLQRSLGRTAIVGMDFDN